MADGRYGRRRLLTVVGTGIATSIAGCGYQPGGGELDWHKEFSSRVGLGSSTDETWLTDDRSLFRIRNWSEPRFPSDTEGTALGPVNDARITCYHATGERVWSQSAEGQYVGDPAVANGCVYLSLEKRKVTALEGPAAESDEGDPEPRWTADWDGSPLSLHATDDTVVGVHEGGLVGFDGDDGTERFTLERGAFTMEKVVDIALAADRLWVLSDGERKDTDTASETSEQTLYGIAADGTIETTRSLPTDSDWIETDGSNALVGVGDEVQVITPDGDRRVAISLDGPVSRSTPIAVGGVDRLYVSYSEVLDAINVSDGEVVWRRDDVSFSGTPVADSDGIYGHGTGPNRDTCGLAAVTSDGDKWWEAPSLEELGCSGDLLLVGDRLVVVDGSDVYGFRKSPGDRWTIL